MVKRAVIDGERDFERDFDLNVIYERDFDFEPQRQRQSLLSLLCCVLEKNTLRHFPLLCGLS